MAKETADQKLQKLIDNPASPEAANSSSGQKAAARMADAVKGSGVPGFSVGSLFGGKTKKSDSRKFFGLREFNQFLIVVIAVIVVLFVVDLISGSKRMQTPMDLSIDSTLGKKFSSQIPTPKHLSNYLSSIETRNIFQPFEKKPVEEVVEDVPDVSGRISSMTQKFKLVGISWLDSAETASVMIEDTETGMTYFARQGDKVKELTIKNIYTDRIILTYEDEEVVIKL